MRTWTRITGLGALIFLTCMLLVLYTPVSNLGYEPGIGHPGSGRFSPEHSADTAYNHPKPVGRKLNRKSSTSNNNSPSVDELKKLAPWDGRVFDSHVQPDTAGGGGGLDTNEVAGGGSAQSRDGQGLKSGDDFFDASLHEKLMGYVEQLPPDELKFYCPHMETLGHFVNRTKKRAMPLTDTWEKFYAGISNCDLYRKHDSNLDNLLNDMRTLPIKQAVLHTGGTQVKLVLTFDNGKNAMMKPLRYGIGYQTNPNHFYFSDFERANAEVAAFHLDRLLGFRRAVPTTGRELNLNEIRAKAEKSLNKTFFISPAKNLCFVGKCDYYCDTGFAICGRPDKIFGSIQTFLLDEDEVPRDHVRSPYRR